MKKSNFKYGIFVVIFLLFVLLTDSVSAVHSAITNAQNEIDSVIVSQGKGDSQDKGDLVAEADPHVIVNKILLSIMGIIGSVALLMFLYNGIMWMLALGNAKKVESAQKGMIYAALGLLVIFSSYAVVEFFIKKMSF